MKELLFRKANGLAHQSLEAGAQGQVLAFQALHRGFARLPLVGGQTRLVGPPGIRKPLFYGPARRFQHRQQPPKRGVGTPPKHKGYHLPSFGILDPPEPALDLFTPHERPHFVGTQPQGPAWFEAIAGAGRRALIHRFNLFFSSPITVCGLMPSTRAVSRTPLPFSAISVILSRTPACCT